MLSLYLKVEVKTNCTEKFHDVVYQAYVMNVKDNGQGLKESNNVSIGRNVKKSLEVIVSKEKRNEKEDLLKPYMKRT